MRAVGVIGSVFGVLMLLAGLVYVQGDAAIAFCFVAVGFTAMLCGATGVAASGIAVQVNALQAKLSQIEERLAAQSSASIEVSVRQAVSELYDEGLLARKKTVSDQDVDGLIE